MMTVRPGVYAACEAKESGNANVTFFDDIKIEKSGVEILEELPAENTTDSILGAEVVVVGGRGVLEEITLNFSRNLLRKSEEQSEEQDQWLIQR